MNKNLINKTSNGIKNSLVALVCLVVMVSFSIMPFDTSAQSDGPPKPSGSGRLLNPLNGIDTIEQLIPMLLKIVVQVGVVVCTFFIIYAGFLYVTAAGNEEKIKKAHSIFLYSVLGTMVLLGAQIISSLLGNTVRNVLG